MDWLEIAPLVLVPSIAAEVTKIFLRMRYKSRLVTAK
jgi:hypothetical protein